MITVQTVGDSRRQDWDSFVGGQRLGNLQQSWGWGEVRRRYGWTVLRLAAVREPGAEWVGVVQVLQHPWKTGSHGLTWGYAPQGPVVSSLRDYHACRALLRATAQRLRSNRMVQLKCDPEWPIDAAETPQLIAYCGLRPARFDFQHRQTWLVELDGGMEAVQSRISHGARRNVRASEKEGVVVARAQGPDAVAVFYQLHLATVSRQKLEPRPPLGYYQAVAEELGATIFIASRAGIPLAAAFIAKFGHRVACLYLGGSDASPSARASYALQWTIIQWGIESGCTVYDMWGMPRGFDPAEPTHSYGIFKTRWGGRMATYTGLMIAPVLGPLDPVVHAVEGAMLSRRWRHRAQMWRDRF